MSESGNVENSSYKLGRWTKLENQKFVEGLNLHGRNWK